MLNSRLGWPQSKTLRRIAALSCLFCLCCLTLSLVVWHNASTRSTPITASNFTLRVNIGFENSLYRSDYWTPVNVSLSNRGPDFTGTLAVKTFSEPSLTSITNTISPWSFEETISLPRGTQRQKTLYVPHYLSSQMARGFIATLKDEHGKTVTSQTTQGRGSEVKPGDLFAGLLTGDDSANFEPLSRVSLPNQSSTSLNVSLLDIGTFPDLEAALENFDIIVLDNFHTSTLSLAQISALRNWVNRGGVLIEGGGPNWQQTLGPLPTDMLPVTITGSDRLAAGTHIIPVKGSATTLLDQVTSLPIDPLSNPLTVNTATLHQQRSFSLNETILAASTNPLIVKAQQGAGVICYLGFDPADGAITSWSGATSFWQVLLSNTLGDKLLIPDTAQTYDSGPGQLLTRGGILSLLEPASPPETWTIGLFLLMYILALGLLSVWMVRRFRLPSWWRWRVVVSCILLFSILSYAMAYAQKKTAITNNSISLIQIDQGSTRAHVTTFMGMYVPGQGDFKLNIDGRNLAEPLDKAFLIRNPAIAPSHDNTPTTVSAGLGTTDLTLHNPGRWSLNPIVAERDSQLQGDIAARLVFHNKRLLGTITNTLNTAMSDLFVLLPNSFAPIGQLAAGETRQVDLPIYSTKPDSGLTLSDQIARYRGLPAGYFPFTQKKQPQNDIQRHVALLSALSGVGFTNTECEGSCLTHTIANKGVIYDTGGQVPNPNLKNGYDPLLIQGAPATLIGWADGHIDGLEDSATVNGITPYGNHTSFIQMPLNIGFSGQVQVPFNFITGNVIDIESNDAQQVLPGAYSLSSGSVTFELPLPDRSHMSINSVSVDIPDLVAHPGGPGSEVQSASGNIVTQIYNWHTASWETARLNKGAFTTTDLQTYAGPSGRILIQITSTNMNQIYFGKPSLSLNGNATE